MNFTYLNNDESFVFTFYGHLNTLVVENFRDIKQIANQAQSVIFDLNEVDYISSRFIRLCMETSLCLNNNSFSVINASEDVYKKFKIAGLDTYFNIRKFKYRKDNNCRNLKGEKFSSS
jgi:anti-anti-sigma factor